MKRIDLIDNHQEKCVGCMSCVDACPVGCISSITKDDGFRYTVIDENKCVNCEKCYFACPIEIQKKNKTKQHLYAAYSKENTIRKNGSSGGLFEIISSFLLENGYFVSGAMFDGTKLRHAVINSRDNLKPLLKSKYIQSDMQGIYTKINNLLKDGKKVFFCGTPCQVSALINITGNELRDRLFTADIICHGVPSQKVFDDYIATVEKKHNGKIVEFNFRVKDNKYKHPHGYSYKVKKDGKEFVVNGIYSNSSFYNAFKNYLIFRDSCYDCQYATVNRVSDITLADFWGIEKYDFDADIEKGVSMIITNTDKGHKVFSALSDVIAAKEFPIQYGIDSNYCLTHSTKKPQKRDEIINSIMKNGYDLTSKKYFQSGLIHKIYWRIPVKLRNAIRKLRRF